MQCVNLISWFIALALNKWGKRWTYLTNDMFFVASNSSRCVLNCQLFFTPSSNLLNSSFNHTMWTLRSINYILKFNCTTASMHYRFCPLVNLTFKDVAKLTAFAAIFKTKIYFRWDIWGSLFIQFHFLSHIRFSLHIFLSFNYFR